MFFYIVNGISFKLNPRSPLIYWNCDRLTHACKLISNVLYYLIQKDKDAQSVRNLHVRVEFDNLIKKFEFGKKIRKYLLCANIIFMVT